MADVMTAAELSIAARMNGMSYGKYVHALKCGMATLPPMSEIRAKMVVQKKRGSESQPVCQYDKKGEYIATYPTTGEAAVALGMERRAASTIRNACTGKVNSAYGFQWRFEGDKAPGIYINRGTMPIRKTERVDMICQMCGKPYKGVKRSRYCSDACADIAKAESAKKYREKKKPKEEKRICKWCGQEFPAEGKRVFCSERCRIDYGWKAQKERKKAQNRKESA